MPEWLKDLLDLFKPKPPGPSPGPRPNVQTLQYAPGLSLDFASAGPGVKPLVILIHGGGWQSGERRRMHPYAPSLLAAGYHCASIDYRLAPANRWPSQREDAVKAYQYLMGRSESLGIDRTRVAVVGKSSGGHIGAMLAMTTSAYIRCLALVSAALDLNGVPTPKQDAALDALFGERRSPHLMADASPVNHVRRSVPPTLLIHGGSDTYVTPSQSATMRRALELAEVPNRFELVFGEDHTFSQAAQEKERAWIVQWFKEHL